MRLAPCIALLLAGCSTSALPEGLKPNSQPDLNFPVGQFSLTERSGKTITEKDLQGSVWVASFVFTRCMGPCPQVTATVARFQADLKDVPGVKFVTFTVDPDRDDAAKLREYAAHFNADPERWLFLTGREEVVHKMMREQFKQAIERKTGEEAKPGDEFGHSTRLLLVDRTGTIRASFDGMPNDEYPDGKERFERDLKRLEERIRELAGK